MQAGEAFQAAFERSVKQLRQESEPMVAAVVHELADRCSAGLSQLRGITAMYRMSARPAPTRSILRSILTAFFTFRRLCRVCLTLDMETSQISESS